MSEWSPKDLRALVDHLARLDVSRLSARQSGALLEIALTRRPALVEQVLHARGPGIFRPHHPAGEAVLPCLQAGDFLFPVSGPLTEGDNIIAAEDTVVGHGTPLLLRRAQEMRST